jgi:hypothetical protein
MSIVTRGYGAHGLIATRGYGGQAVVTEPTPQEICHLTSAIERAIYTISPIFSRVADVSFVNGEFYGYSRIEMECHLDSKITKEQQANSSIKKQNQEEVQSKIEESVALNSSIKCDCKK